MAKFINMPKMGNTVTAVIFSEWHVKEGDKINQGDKLFSYETDKTTTEELAKESGTVLKLLVSTDQEVPVFAPVMIIGNPDEDITPLLNEVKTEEKKEPKSVMQDVKTSSEVKQTAPLPEVETLITNQDVVQTKKAVDKSLTNFINNEGKFSPRAIRALRNSGIPLDALNYRSGPEGAIVSQDITKAMDVNNLQQAKSNNVNPIMKQITEIISHANGEGDEKFVYSPMRAMIAKGMKKSQQDAAFVTLSMAIDANKLLQARKKFKLQAAKGQADISLNDLIIYATSRVLPKYHKTINAHVFDNEAVGHYHANIAVAVDTPIGLLVPVIKQANLKSLVQISKEAQALIKTVRQGTYKGVDLSSGTFTISNVGNMGIEVFTPVLNAGQASILGVGTTVLRPRQNQQGLVEFYNAMILSLTVDHRLVDGADGARFLNDLKLVLENIDVVIG